MANWNHFLRCYQGEKRGKRIGYSLQSWVAVECWRYSHALIRASWIRQGSLWLHNFKAWHHQWKFLTIFFIWLFNNFCVAAMERRQYDDVGAKALLSASGGVCDCLWMFCSEDVFCVSIFWVISSAARMMDYFFLACSKEWHTFATGLFDTLSLSHCSTRVQMNDVEFLSWVSLRVRDCSSKLLFEQKHTVSPLMSLVVPWSQSVNNESMLSSTNPHRMCWHSLVLVVRECRSLVIKSHEGTHPLTAVQETNP